MGLVDRSVISGSGISPMNEMDALKYRFGYSSNADPEVLISILGERLRQKPFLSRLPMLECRTLFLKILLALRFRWISRCNESGQPESGH